MYSRNFSPYSPRKQASKRNQGTQRYWVSFLLLYTAWVLGYTKQLSDHYWPESHNTNVNISSWLTLKGRASLWSLIILGSPHPFRILHPSIKSILTKAMGTLFFCYSLCAHLVLQALYLVSITNVTFSSPSTSYLWQVIIRTPFLSVTQINCLPDLFCVCFKVLL